MRSRRPYAAFGFPGWRGVPFLFLLSFLALLAPPTPIHGQVVRGHLLDNETRQPIISGAVALMDSLGGAVARTLTNEEGAFELTAPEPGMYTLMAAGMGYRSTPSGRLDLINNQLITIDMHLLPKPLRLEPIMVTAERIRAELARQGFYDRRDSGRGFFVSPEEIRRRPPINELEVIRRAPFVYMNPGREGNAMIMRAMGDTCTPILFVDGWEISWFPGRVGIVEDWVNFSEITAVEVFRGFAEIPLDWAAWTNDCGLVLVWTKWSEQRSKKRGGGGG
ncbi:carboxypeptidase regulatory-like domain-containing protein [Gemmatimonadota bacterium]